jgi:hypothetical protein
MTLARYYARAGADRTLIATVAAELRSRWDPDAEFQAPDGEHAAESHALTILGILATGADTAGVKGYLRRAEIAALGEPRTTSPERGDVSVNHDRRGSCSRIWKYRRGNRPLDDGRPG